MSEPRGQGPNQEEARTAQATPATQPALELRAVKLTDVGKARPHNEDYVDFSIPSDPRLLALKGSIFAVADGMGGHQAGEVASKGAVEAAIAAYQADTGHDVGTSLIRAFRAANQQLYAQAEGDPSKGGMGTTLVAAVLLGRRVYVANVGDSRAYLINNRGITQITEDHSWVEEQVRAGLLNEEQARRHPQRNLVTRALGSKPAVEVDLFEGEIAAGDTLLLCSDGLTGRIANQEIADIVREHPPAEAARRLVALANDRGGHDNVTVLLINAQEATAAGKPPLATPSKPQAARGSQMLPLVAVLGGLLLLVAVAAAVLAASGILPLPFLQDATAAPPLTITLSPTSPTAEASLTAEATELVVSTGVPTPTATLSPTGVALTSPAASPSPSLGVVTLISPADGITLTGPATFTWAFGPGLLPQGLAFQLVIGEGDPSDPGARNVGRPHRRLEQFVELDEVLPETGEYYWTVRVVDTSAVGGTGSEAPPRTLIYQGPTTPGARRSRPPGGG